MITAIILARGGSKGVRKKNSRMLGPKSLIDWTIDFAVQEHLVSSVIVSTDSLEICQSSKHLQEFIEDFEETDEGNILVGKKKVSLHKRRQMHAGSLAKSIDAILDIIDNRSFKADDRILLLQPTSPFREKGEISKISEYYSSQDVEGVVSGKVFDSPHPSKAVLIDKNNFLLIGDSDSNLSSPRQELPTFYIFDGAYYFSTVKSIIHHKSLIPSKTILFVREGISTLNIDSELDFRIAEKFVEEML